SGKGPAQNRCARNSTRYELQPPCHLEALRTPNKRSAISLVIIISYDCKWPRQLATVTSRVDSEMAEWVNEVGSYLSNWHREVGCSRCLPHRSRLESCG